MSTRLLISAILIFLVSACGTAPQAAEQPTSPPQIVTRIVVVTATSPPATTTKEATTTPTPRPTSTPKPTATPVATGKWQIEKEKSTFDDTTTVFLSLDADKDITGPVGDFRPSLILRCQEKETEVFLAVGMQPDVEGLDDTATVRLRLDKEDAFTVKAGKSTLRPWKWLLISRG